MRIYLEQTRELMANGAELSNAIGDFYGERRHQAEVVELAACHKQMLEQFWTDFKGAVERDSLSVLNTLLTKFQTPQHLIEKRCDKLLDFDSCNKRAEANKGVKTLQDAMSAAKNNYEALNRQLLDELPKLCDIAVDVLKSAIESFLFARYCFS